MPEFEKVINQLEIDYRVAERKGDILVPVSRRTVKDAIDLLKEQEERIKQLESMNVTASGNGTAIGVVKGGLVIGKQTAKEITNIKHVEVMSL